VRRVPVIILFALLLAGCGGEETVSPTGPVEGELPKAAKGNPAKGKAVFTGAGAGGCGGCHALDEAGTNASLGPNLDEALQGKDAEYIEEAIVNPNAEIAQGFQPNIMPDDYGSKLSRQQLADLVAFLDQAT
jgi:mono/diheme cytochrome c family protein